MKKITPCLWFDNAAEEAVNFYIAIFKNSGIDKVTRYGDSASEVSGMPKGSVLTISFRIDGEEFLALNGGPVYKFSPAISFIVDCGTQEEIDHLWDKLSEGGEKVQCGWLTDKYGVSWQIVPAILDELINDPDPVASERVMRAMIQMIKLDIRTLEDAYNGE